MVKTYLNNGLRIGILFFTFFFACKVTFGQSYVFKILALKGHALVKVNSTWLALKSGEALKAGEEIKVNANSYIALVHTSGRPLEIKVEGIYKVDDLNTNFKQEASILSKYFNFILTSNSEREKKNKLSAVGGVRRDLYDINLLLPSRANMVLKDALLIEWETATLEPYVIEFRNMYGDLLDKAVVNEHLIEINFEDPKFKNEPRINMIVSCSSCKTSNRIISRLPEKEQIRLKEQVAKLQHELGQRTSVTELAMASFYEQNELFADAADSYLRAIKLSPDILSYQEYFHEYLVRNKLKDP